VYCKYNILFVTFAQLYKSIQTILQIYQYLFIVIHYYMTDKILIIMK